MIISLFILGKKTMCIKIYKQNMAKMTPQHSHLMNSSAQRIAAKLSITQNVKGVPSVSERLK